MSAKHISSAVQFDELCINAATTGAAVAKSNFGKTVRTEIKSDSSVVTKADLDSEAAIRTVLAPSLSTTDFDGEESPETNTGKERKWIVDPIDGTDNFAIGVPVFSTSVALVSNSDCICGAIVNPITNEIFFANNKGEAFLNGVPLLIARTRKIKNTRVAFLPDFRSKRADTVKVGRDRLSEKYFRVIDSWAPALDWCLLASAKIEGIVQVTTNSPRPDAGYLIASNAGVTIYPPQRIDDILQSDFPIYLVVAARSRELADELSSCFSESAANAE